MSIFNRRPRNSIKEITLLKQADLQAGDVVHIALGIMDMGDGLPPWIPGHEQLEAEKVQFEAVLPAGVKVIVTHFGVSIEAVLHNLEGKTT